MSDRAGPSGLMRRLIGRVMGHVMGHVIGIVAFLLAAYPACAEVRGIVVGFNDYQSVPKLNGALNDVNDLAASLRKRGVTDLTVMTEPTATIADFDRRWNGIVSRSKPGDLIIFTFAGHGAILRDRRVPQVSPDGKEKGFLFPTFDKDARPDSAGFNELLRDEDLYDRFQATAAKGIRVIFVADACHAGSGVRSADPRSAGKAFRFAPVIEAPSPTLPPPVQQTKRPPIPNVTVFSAQIEERTILEIRADGQSRGALSYTFARGIEGAADTAHPGAMTVGDLWQFTREGVRTRSENAQSPEVYTPQADLAKPVFSTGAAPPASPVAQRDIVVYSLGRQVPLARAIYTSDRRTADLIWDPGRQQVIGPTGDILSSDIGDAALQGAVDARRLVEYLRSLADTKGNLRVAVRASRDPEGAGSDRVYRANETIAINASELAFRASTVLAISANGVVTLLFPTTAGDLASNGSRINGIVVQEPFGTDVVAFINTERSLETVTSAFGRARASDGQLGALDARAVLDLLRNTIEGLPLRVGTQAVVTCKTQRADNTCDTQLPSSH